MNADYPSQAVTATPEYILAVLKDHHRQQCQFDSEANKEILLTFDSTIQEFQGFDFVDCRSAKQKNGGPPQ